MNSTVELATAIDALLPQTQCRKCGYDGCRPYADAIAAGTAPVNRCPPGGAAGIERLAGLLGVPPLPLDPACGRESTPQVAHIVAADCIGCTLCIQACPVDAIIGAPKLMHGVLAEHCTGCELCLPPCPVDCIELVDAGRPSDPGAARDFADASRDRYLRRLTRLQRPRPDKRSTKRTAAVSAEERRQQTIERAMARARERLAARTSG